MMIPHLRTEACAIVMMNLIFSFDSILSALAIPKVFSAGGGDRDVGSLDAAARRQRGHHL